MVFYLCFWKALYGPLFNVLCTTSVERVEQRMAFTWVLLCHLHNKVSAIADYVTLTTLKQKCEVDLQCSSGPVQITSCPQSYLRELCSEPLYNFSHGCSHQPAPPHGRSPAICWAEPTPRPTTCILLPTTGAAPHCLLSLGLASFWYRDCKDSDLTVSSATLVWAGSPCACRWQHESHSCTVRTRVGSLWGKEGVRPPGQQWGQGSSKGLQILWGRKEKSRVPQGEEKGDPHWVGAMHGRVIFPPCERVNPSSSL